MSTPTVAVSIEFTAGVWTDVSQYVDLGRGIHGMGRGRRDERSETTAYSATLTLSNQDGRFTPDNPDSPYYPNVQVGKRVRVSVTVGAATSDRFTGYATSWPPEFPGGELAETTITIVDRIGWKDARRRMRSVPEEAVLSYSPGAYWPLGDAADSTSAVEVSGSRQPSLEIRQYGTGGEITFAAATGVPRDSMSSPSFAPASTSAGKFLAADLAKPVGDGTGVGICCSFNVAAAPAADVVLVECNDYSSSWRLQMLLTTAGKVSIKEYWPDSGTFYQLTHATVVTDGESHAATVELSVEGGFVVPRIRVDGGGVTTTNWALHTLWPVARVYVGGDPWAGDLMTGSIGHVAVFATPPNTGLLSSHIRYGLDSHAVGDAITDVRTWGGIDSGDVVLPTPGFDLDTEGAGITHRPTEGKTPAQVLLALAGDEGGHVSLDGSGRYVFRERSHRWDSMPVLDIESRHLARPDLALTFDTQGLANDVTASQPGNGSSQRAMNDDSVALFGNLDDSLEAAVPTERELLERAGWEANVRAYPYVRVGELPVDLLTMDAASTEAFLALAVWDKVQVVDLPGQAPGSALPLDVEGWTESLSLTSWTVTLNTSKPVSDLLLRLDDAVTVLDAGYITGY